MPTIGFVIGPIMEKIERPVQLTQRTLNKAWHPEDECVRCH
jgi:hypothetical protein